MCIFKIFIITGFLSSHTFAANNKDPKAQEKIYHHNNIILEEVDFNGKPEEVYYIDKKIIALDAWEEGRQVGLRMKINGKEQILRFNKGLDNYQNAHYKMSIKMTSSSECEKDSEGIKNGQGEILLQSIDNKTSKKFIYQQTFYGCP